MEKIKDPPNYRVLKTAACYYTIIGLGMAYTMLGPALINLDLYFCSDSTPIVLVFTFHGFGFIVGSMLSYLLSDAAKEIQIGVSVAVQGLVTIITVLQTSRAGFLGLYTMAGVAMGLYDSALQSFCLNLWTGHRWQRAIYQTMNLIFGIGCILGPMLVKQFVVEIVRHPGYVNLTSFNISGSEEMLLTLENSGVESTVILQDIPLNSSAVHDSRYPSVSGNIKDNIPVLPNDIADIVNGTVANGVVDTRYSNVTYAFIIHGCMLLMAGFLLFVITLLDAKSIWTQCKRLKGDDDTLPPDVRNGTTECKGSNDRTKSQMVKDDREVLDPLLTKNDKHLQAHDLAEDGHIKKKVPVDNSDHCKEHIVMTVDAYALEHRDETCDAKNKQSLYKGCCSSEGGGLTASRRFYIGVLSFLFLHFFIFNFTLVAPQNIFSTYVVKGLGWSVSDSALLAAAMPLANLAGRLLGVPLAMVLRPATNLAANTGVTFLGFLLLLATPSLGREVMWVSAVIIGVGTSSTYGVLFLWASSHVPVTGRVAAVGITGFSTGQMISGATTGAILRHFGNTMFVYVFVGFAGAHGVVCIVSMLYTRYADRGPPNVVGEVITVSS